MNAGRLRLLLPLVFCSGCCALVYQIGWLRELRLVFGASTYASSATLAIFMGGLGLGGVVLGRRADRHRSPLALYGRLELGVAAGALLSPFLFVVVRNMYLASGGTSAMGQPAAHAVRLALSSLVLGLPTFLMGGTLPAAVKYAETADGGYRRGTALLYGVNTLGGLCGVAATTFFLLERFGTRATVLSAAGLNVLVGLAALLAASMRAPAERPMPAAAGPATLEAGDAALGVLRPAEATVPTALVSAAAALTGFVFFLMEIVWYRVLAPLLGGTTYSFGLILAVALAGIGLGGALASLQGRRVRPTVLLFAATCGLEAVGIALAFGLGDQVAILALSLRSAVSGLPATVAGWALVCAVVVFPAALVSGYQFPLLIGLLGRGGRDVGRHVGVVYLWSTAGAIAGSLLGGFGLLPALGALGCWRLAVAILGACCVAAVVYSLRREGRRFALVVPLAATAAALALIALSGPTAVWRHSPIGAGLLRMPTDRTALRDWLNARRFSVIWEKDGIESTIGIERAVGLSFVVNGKVDGNAKIDAGTQVMAPLVGAILHPEPKRAMVIGLGTGSSAGWLAAVESMERVDVGELEPAVVEVARRCEPVNRGVLTNPRVRMHFGDAREMLMTTKERYDLIVSEPSNPYRAGVASLYTLEFYRAVAGRLATGGIFSQWVQAYSVDQATVGRIAATLAAVFGNVEIWVTSPTDLLFVCSDKRLDYQVPRLADRIAAAPYRDALLAAWGLDSLEGFLSAFLAGDAFVRQVAGRFGGEDLNTDDRSPVEFGFARSLGLSALNVADFRREARGLGADRPAVAGGEVDWSRVESCRVHALAWQGEIPTRKADDAASIVYTDYLRSDNDTVIQIWEQGWWRPREPFEHLMLAEALAATGDGRALALLPDIAARWPAAAAAIEADLLWRTGAREQALLSFERAVAGFRTDPWNPLEVMNRSLHLGVEMAETDPRFAARLFDLYEQPFSVHILDAERVFALVGLARIIDCRHGERALAQYEPHVPVIERVLRYRAECYAETGSPLAGRAQRDLETFLQESPKSGG